MSTAVDIVPGVMPAAWCYSTAQDLLETLVANITASIPGVLNSYNYGPAVPGADARDRFWVRTDSNFTPDRIYNWSTLAAAWVAPHSVPPGTVWLYTGDIALIDTFDGGQAGAATAFTGVMWEKLTAMDGKMPIGPGTLDQGTVVALAGTGGTEKVILTEANLAPHTHVVNGYPHSLSAATDQPSNQIIIDDDWKTPTLAKATAQGGGTGSPLAATAHQNMPPFYGIWFIKKSVRTHYRV